MSFVFYSLVEIFLNQPISEWKVLKGCVMFICIGGSLETFLTSLILGRKSREANVRITNARAKTRIYGLIENMCKN